jgi:peptidoglycan/xylan/chitin deacetylase (PgdA/CDA1 family)
VTLLIVVILVVILVGLVAMSTLFRPSNWVLKRVAGFYPGTVFCGNTNERIVALTFDDAPHPDVTPGILRELRANSAHATFFIIGGYAQAYPELIEAIRAEGHELANHLFTDRVSARLSDDAFVDELLRTDALIQPLGSPKWCRPGSGVFTPRIVRLMRENGYTPVAGTAYPVDLYTSIGLTAAHFLQNLRPGAVLVLHDGGSKRINNIRVLQTVLPRIRDRGYRMVTLSELNGLCRA